MWLEQASHQGAGLERLYAGTQAAATLLPVIATPDARAELEALWRLCGALQGLGYTVAVLDATARESAQAPGLAQLLGARGLPAQAMLSSTAQDATMLPVLPAAQGLRLLGAAHHGSAALERLHAPFRAYTALVLYAPAPLAAPLLQGSACRPLVLTGAGAQGMVRCYLQLKHMALHAGLSCAVAAITGAADTTQAAQTREALQALERSARQMLGLAPHVSQIRAHEPRELRRLALQLLENGCALGETRSGYDHTRAALSH